MVRFEWIQQDLINLKAKTASATTYKVLTSQYAKIDSTMNEAIIKGFSVRKEGFAGDE